MTFWEKLKDLFVEDTEDIVEHSFDVPVRGEGSNIISLHPHMDNAQEVVVLRPKNFNDALMAVHFLKSRCMVVVNVDEMEEEESQRLVDFISGSTFALDGSHERIGNGIFVLTPSNIGIRHGSAAPGREGLFARG